MNIEENSKFDICAKLVKNQSSIENINSNITFNSISVSVLPKNTEWYDLEGFVSKKYGPFIFNFINTNNEIIAGMSFYISYNCKGTYDGLGAFLNELTVAPKMIFANPGYHFTCNVTSGKPVNYGTKTNPIAGITLQIQIQVKSYNKLLPNENCYLLEDSSTSNNSLTSAKPLDPIDSSALYNSNRNNYSSKFYAANKLTYSNTSLTCYKDINTIEKYLVVCIRGDCMAYIISACDY